MKINWQYKSVVGRAILYFSISVLTPVSALLTDTAKTDTFPSKAKFIACLITGVLAGAVALRAYFDGSAQRWADKNNQSTPTQPTNN